MTEVATSNQEEEVPSYKTTSCSTWIGFSGLKEARGFAAMNAGRGPLLMSNIFLSTALITLAREAAGCEANDIDNTECSKKIYGFKPGSLIPNIATVAGVLSAFFMPTIGAILDFTPYRRQLGIVAVSLLVVIQLAQIGTTGRTWFAMAILQAFSGFVYGAENVTQLAYLPEIARKFGEKKMSNVIASFNVIYFVASLFYILGISGIALFFKLGTVSTAQISQGIISLVIMGTYGCGWRFMPKVEAKNVLNPNTDLVKAGFLQVWETAKHINKEYGGGLRWFFFVVAIGNAGISSFLSLAIVYMTEYLGASSNEVGIASLILIISTVPGTLVGAMLAKKTNPKISWGFSFSLFVVFTIIGGFILSPETKVLINVWSVLWGGVIGWFGHTENLFFALAVPKGPEEAILTGFLIYCRYVLIWFPPLLFTIVNESGASMQFAFMCQTIFYLTSILCLFPMDSWTKVIEHRHHDVEINLP